jgi:hypothetical protein
VAVAFVVLLPALVSESMLAISLVPWFNRAIQGQAQHSLRVLPVARRRRAALLGSAAAFFCIVTAAAAWRWRSRIADAWHRLVAPLRPIGASDVIAYGRLVRLLGGLAEVTSLRLRYAGDPVEITALHVLWMGPISAACMGAIIGLLLALAFRAWRGVSIGVPGRVLLLIRTLLDRGRAPPGHSQVRSHGPEPRRRDPTGAARHEACRCLLAAVSPFLPWMAGAGVAGAVGHRRDRRRSQSKG